MALTPFVSIRENSKQNTLADYSVDCNFDLHAAGALGVCGGKLKLVDAYCAETRARDRLARVGKGDFSRPADLFPGDGQLAVYPQPILLATAAEREFLIRACGEGGGGQRIGAGIDVRKWVDHLNRWRTVDANASCRRCQVEAARDPLRAIQFKFVERIERFCRRRGSLSGNTHSP